MIEYKPNTELLKFDSNVDIVMDFDNERIKTKKPVPMQDINKGRFPLRLRRSDWNQDNSILQKTVVIFIMADWLQTRHIANNPHKFEEANRILGPNPSLGEVDRYFAFCLIGNTLIAYLLPQGLRTRWQALSLRMQAETVNHNYNMGVKFSL